MISIRNFLGIALLLLSFSGYAQDLYFAGFSFIGAATEDENYPVAMTLYNEDNQLLNKQLNATLKRLQRKDLNIVSDMQGRIKSGNSVVLAYGLQRESVAVFQIEGGYQYKIDITGLVYVFDYADQEKKLITSLPTGTSVTVTSKTKLSKDELNKYVENVYIPNRNQMPIRITFDSGANQISVFDSWVDGLEKVKITRASKDTRLQIRNISLDEAVVKQLPATSLYLKDSRMLVTETARNLERNLASNQQVPILPYSIGRALGGSMIARFSDTNFEIKLPEPDFVIDVLVREFKKSVVKTKVYDGYIYGAFITLKLVEPVTGQVKMESKFNFKDEIQVPVSYNLVIEDDWPSWLGAQKKLFEILSKQITQRNDSELATISSTPNIKDQLKKLEEVLNQCR